MAFFTEFSAGLLQELLELRWIGVGAAWDLFATDVRIGPVDHGEAKFAIAILWGPGDALKRFKCAVGNQKSFVDTERGGHGVFSL